MHCKVFVQYRFGEEPVLAFETVRSARFNEVKPNREAGHVGRVGDALEAAKSFAFKLRSQVPCNIVIEEEPIKEGKGGK